MTFIFETLFIGQERLVGLTNFFYRLNVHLCGFLGCLSGEFSLKGDGATPRAGRRPTGRKLLVEDSIVCNTTYDVFTEVSLKKLLSTRTRRDNSKLKLN